MKTELVGQMTNNFSSFSLAVIIIFQWAAGSSSSEDVFLFQILQQKMSCGKNYMKSNPCWLLACVGLSFCKGVGDLTERSRRVFFFFFICNDSCNKSVWHPLLTILQTCMAPVILIRNMYWSKSVFLGMSNIN